MFDNLDDKKKYTLIINGKRFENLSVNGNNFISPTPIDKTLLKGLMTVEIADGETTEAYTNVSLIEKIGVPNGENPNCWLAFSQLSESQVKEMELNAKIEYLSMMTGVEV